MAAFIKYYDPDFPRSYSGARSFEKAIGKPVTKWLRTQDVYSLHKQVKTKFQRRKTIVPGAQFQMQADLIDFSGLQKYNDNYKYILVMIDVFTKYAYAVSLKNKSSATMIAAFDKLLKQSGKFIKLQTDRGKEFVHKPFQTWLKKRGIKLFHSHDYSTKAAIAERFICTLKEKLWRYFTHKNTRRYIDILPSIVASYNNTYHSSIKMTPSEVDSSNQEHVWQTLYGDIQVRKPKLNVRDTVRLATTRATFQKGYLPKWTEEIFVVAQAISGDPPYYHIKDLNNETLEGTFYDSELQKINKNDDTYQIERIVKTRTRRKERQYLIKWVGYPESFNSWVRERDMIRYA